MLRSLAVLFRPSKQNRKSKCKQMYHRLYLFGKYNLIEYLNVALGVV